MCRGNIKLDVVQYFQSKTHNYNFPHLYRLGGFTSPLRLRTTRKSSRRSSSPLDLMETKEVFQNFTRNRFVRVIIYCLSRLNFPNTPELRHVKYDGSFVFTYILLYRFRKCFHYVFFFTFLINYVCATANCALNISCFHSLNAGSCGL